MSPPPAAFQAKPLSSHLVRYGPRQSKNTAYNEKGRLNVEVKFAPFSCTRRRVPIRVCSTCVFLLSVLLIGILGCRRSVRLGANPTSVSIRRQAGAPAEVNYRCFHHGHRERRHRGMHCSWLRGGKRSSRRCRNRDARSRCVMLCGACALTHVSP